MKHERMRGAKGRKGMQQRSNEIYTRPLPPFALFRLAVYEL